MKKFNAHRKLKGAILMTIFAARSTRGLTNAARSHTTAGGGPTSGVHNGVLAAISPSSQTASKAKVAGLLADVADENSEEAQKQLIEQLTEATIKFQENGDYESYSLVNLILRRFLCYYCACVVIS